MGNLWCVHTIGPDDIEPAPDFETAWRWSERQNALIAKYEADNCMSDDDFWPEVRCIPALWPWGAEAHAAALPTSIANFTPRDSDRSGEAGETGTGSTEGESADPKGIAQAPSDQHRRERA